VLIGQAGKVPVIPNVVSQLSNGDKSALKLGNANSLGKVGVDQVVDGQEVRHGLTASPGKLADFLAEGCSSTLHEGSHNRMIFSLNELAEKLLLVGGLVAEDNKRHFRDVFEDVGKILWLLFLSFIIVSQRK
jgi:hypothetical protein